MQSHRYVRAYLAGSALPTLVVSAAGLIAVVFFDRLEPPVQRALLLPVAINPAIWGFWNVLWVALGPSRRVQIGWHGAVLAVLLIGVGLLLAVRLNVSEITPERGGTVLLPTGFAYYLLWRYGVSFLNSVVCVDAPPRTPERGKGIA
jgi:hypothetical protein